MKKFFGILTEIGQAKQANALALGKTLRITEIEVGDGGGENAPLPTPDPKQKNLINSRHRAPINQLRVDPNNANYMIAEQIIPENEGGWWIREMGARDEDGDLVAVSNCAPTYKPLLAEGSGRQQVARMIFMVSGAGVFELKIDPAVVLATRQYVDEATKKLQTARLISLTGAVSGSALFDGSNNIEIETVGGGAIIWVPYRATVPLKKEGDIIMVKNLGELHWVETPFFTGYRSPLVGKLELDTTVTPSPWQIDAVGTVLNKSDYPGLWAHAQENGLAVNAASWTPRVLRYADLSATQFRGPDLRDMFFRGAGTDQDTGEVRALGTLELDAMQGHGHDLFYPHTGKFGGSLSTALNTTLSTGIASNYATGTLRDTGKGAPRSSVENRPMNVALHTRLHI